MKKIEIFTDGSCNLHSDRSGGYCAILRYRDSKKIVKGGEKSSTNNRMELKAVIEGLKTLKESYEVTIISDSKYVVDGINLYIERWADKDFKKVKNRDLWREYFDIKSGHRVKAQWVKSHSGHVINEQCDRIAKEEALKG